MRKLIILLIKLYQKTLSPQTGSLKFLHYSPIFSLSPGHTGCRHSITCSQYTLERIRDDKSIVSAVISSARRIINCHF